jgi:uncharacterized protein (DUF2225 family)
MKLWGKKEYTCAACGAKFDAEAKLTEHSKIHTAPMAANQ